MPAELREDWEIPDPKHMDPEEFRKVRNEIELKVRALLTRKTYPKGVKVTKKEFAGIEIQRHKVCSAWNYTISPRKATSDRK